VQVYQVIANLSRFQRRIGGPRPV